MTTGVASSCIVLILVGLVVLDDTTTRDRLTCLDGTCTARTEHLILQDDVKPFRAADVQSIRTTRNTRKRPRSEAVTLCLVDGSLVTSCVLSTDVRVEDVQRYMASPRGTLALQGRREPYFFLFGVVPLLLAAGLLVTPLVRRISRTERGPVSRS